MFRIKQIKTFLILIAAMVAYVPAEAGRNKGDTTLCLLVDGRIINAGDGDSDTHIELLEGNTVVETMDLKGNRKKFTFDLRRDRHYIIRMSKPGYQTKNICVHTTLPSNLRNHFKFEFETKLSEIKPNVPVNPDLEKSPVASIYFHEKKQSFYYHKSFSAYYQKQLCKAYQN